jgi:starch synthase
MKVLIAASEIATLAQTGGLADVMRSLPIALKKKGIEVALVMPKFRQVETECEDLGEIRIPIEDKFIMGRIQRAHLENTGIPVFLIEQDQYYNREQLYTEKGRDYPDNLERFTFFCRATLELVARGLWQADLIHANDWQTSLIPTYIKTLFKDHPVLGKIKTLFTVHNLAYQGLFPGFLYPILGLSWDHFNLSELEFYNQINLLKGGVVFSDAINTVSPNYAREIQSPEFGNGLEGILQEKSEKLTGILNRVDYAQWSPENDSFIEAPYSIDTAAEGKAINKKALLKEFGLPESDFRKPLFGVVSRITSQKGCDLIASIIPSLVQREAQVIIQGTGDPKIEDTLTEMQRQFPYACSVHIAYDTRLSHWIEAGSDIFLMPSRFEPCGLNQMYSLRYGTIPIVRAIGGLADTVRDIQESPDGNGFTFDEESPGAFMEVCDRAITLFEDEKAWLELIKRGMQIDFSWDRSAQDYIRLYQSIL